MTGGEAERSAQLAAFASEFWSTAADGFGLLWTLAGDVRRSVWFDVADATQITEAADAIAHMVSSADCYYGLATRHAGMDRNRRGGDVDCLAQLGIGADLDVAGPGHKTTGQLFPSMAAALDVLARLPLAPTFIVDTGGGIQAVWCLAEAEDAQSPFLAGLRRRLVETLRRLAGDCSAAVDDVADAARILRLPWTINHKEGLTRPTSLIEVDWGRRYDPSQLDEMLDELRPEVPYIGPASRAGSGSYADEAWPGTAYNALVKPGAVLVDAGFTYQRSDRAGNQYYVRPGKEARGGGHSAVVYADDGHATIYSSAAVQLWPTLEVRRPYDAFGLITHFKYGGSFSVASQALARENYGQADAIRVASPGDGGPGLDDDGLDMIGPAGPFAKPSIRTNTEMVDVGRATLAALEVANKDSAFLFIRGGELSEVRVNERGRHTVKAIDAIRLQDFASQSARYLRVLKSKDGGNRSTDVYPPIEVMRQIVRLDRWPFPVIDGIAETPILRPNGTICTTPGYDVETRFYHSPSPQLYGLHVPEEPTADQVTTALATLAEPVREFPFIDEASMVNAIGLILTAVLRPAIDGTVPLYVIDSTSPGTGKGMLADVISVIATGKEAPSLQLSGDSEEARKVLTSLLLDGRPIISVDNIEGPLRSKVLASALTQAVWSDRRLGQTDSIEIPVRCTWIANGNGIQLQGDLPRRAVWIRLDARDHMPWLRNGFKHRDLLAYVRANRRELVAACFTLARAWHVAGKPEPTSTTLGSYPAWWSLIGGALALAGLGPAFMANSEERYREADDDRDDWSAFLEAVEGIYPEGRTFTASQVAQIVDGNRASWDELVPVSLLYDLGTPRFPKMLGYAFRAVSGRRWGIDGLRLMIEGKNRLKVRLYRIVRGDDSTGEDSPRFPAIPALDTDAGTGIDDAGRVEAATEKATAGNAGIEYPITQELFTNGESTPRFPAFPATTDVDTPENAGFPAAPRGPFLSFPSSRERGEGKGSFSPDRSVSAEDEKRAATERGKLSPAYPRSPRPSSVGAMLDQYQRWVDHPDERPEKWGLVNDITWPADWPQTVVIDCTICQERHPGGLCPCQL